MILYLSSFSIHSQFSLSPLPTNSDNLKDTKGIGADGRRENYKDVIDKTSKISMHEDGHSKFVNHPRADKEGHVINTIMDENPGSIVNPKHDDWMVKRLKSMHGSTDFKKE